MSEGVVALMLATIFGNVCVLIALGWMFRELSAWIEPDWLYQIAARSGRLVGGPGAP